MKKEELTFLPVSLCITGKKILIIGGGKVGYHKATLLNRFTDQATVISPEFLDGFNTLPFERLAKRYEKEDLSGVFLVYICTENEALNAQIKEDAGELGVLASVCDNPACCDFISPAIYKEKNVTVAVSSNARNVYQSIDIRNQIGKRIQEGIISIQKENDTVQVSY